MATPMHPQGGGARVGRYALLRRLKAGGMGEVFVARAEGANEPVALKLLLPHLCDDTRFVQMFLDEARIAARMKHPNIVPIHDLGEADGRYFIAMSLVEGASLSALLRAARTLARPVPLPVGRAIAQALCAALAHAHALRSDDGRPLGIVHRDVTPSNVLLSKKGEIFLSDFGLARAADNLHRSRSGDLKGTFAYMSPEQASPGGKVTARSDLFSLGSTLFETFTLTSPFHRGSDLETLEAVRVAAAPDPKAHRPELSDGVAAGLRHALTKDPEARVQTAEALSKELADGPVASPDDVAAWVRELLPELSSAEAAIDVRTEQTAPLGQPKTVTSPPPGEQTSGARRWALAGLLAVGVLGVAGWALWPRSSTRPAAVDTRGERGAEGRAGAGAVTSATVDETRSPDARHDAGRSDAVASSAEPPKAGAPEAARSSPPRVDAPGEGGTASGGSRSTSKHSQPAGHTRQRGTSAKASDAGGHVLHSSGVPKIGFLTVNVAPWATVWVDGKEIERTPLSRFPLEAGHHQLRFKNPAYAQPLSRAITVKDGEEVRLNLHF